VKEFFVYGSMVLAGSVVVGMVFAELHDYLRERREKNLCSRAIRLQDHHYTFPLSEEQHEDLEDWAEMVELSKDQGWIDCGISIAWMYAVDPEAREEWDREQAA
jgi:hypothetical protein